MNITIAQKLSEGKITHEQACQILETLYYLVTEEVRHSTSIRFDECDSWEMTQGFVNLTDRSCTDGREADVIFLSGMDNISVKHKTIWMLYALTSPYYMTLKPES